MCTNSVMLSHMHTGSYERRCEQVGDAIPFERISLNTHGLQFWHDQHSRGETQLYESIGCKEIRSTATTVATQWRKQLARPIDLHEYHLCTPKHAPSPLGIENLNSHLILPHNTQTPLSQKLTDLPSSAQQSLINPNQTLRIEQSSAQQSRLTAQHSQERILLSQTNGRLASQVVDRGPLVLLAEVEMEEDDEEEGNGSPE